MAIDTRSPPKPALPVWIAEGLDVTGGVYAIGDNDTIWFWEPESNAWESIPAPPAIPTQLISRVHVAGRHLCALCNDGNIYVTQSAGTGATFQDVQWVALPPLP